MNKAKLLATAIMALGSQAALANSYTVNPDEDTCWSPPNWCIEASAQWSEYTEDRLIVTYSNVCQHRVYLRKCNAKNNGNEDCGAGGLAGGRSTKWSTSDATGNYRWKMVGVLQGSKDWVCAGKISNWHD